MHYLFESTTSRILNKFTKNLEIINFLYHRQQTDREKAVVADVKQPEQATLSDGDPNKGKYQRGLKPDGPDDEEARKLKMGKGKIPDKKDDGEAVKLKPIPDKVNLHFCCSFMTIKRWWKFCLCKNFNDDIKFSYYPSQPAEKSELKPSDAKVINFDSFLKNFN